MKPYKLFNQSHTMEVMSGFKHRQANCRAHVAILPYRSYESQDGFIPGSAFHGQSVIHPLWRTVTKTLNQVQLDILVQELL